MKITLIDNTNFCLSSLDNFSRYQEVKNVYRFKNGILHIEYHPFIEDWSLEQKRKKAEKIMSGRYIAFGAYENGEVVGAILLLPELDHGRMMIDSFHVSAAHRRRGIGRALFETAKAEAIRCGAKALYASACSSQETIDFYTAMGFIISPNPIQSCVDDEPQDIQMECRIS